MTNGHHTLWTPDEMGIYVPATPDLPFHAPTQKNPAKQRSAGKGNNGEWLAAAAIKHFSPDWCGPFFIAFMESGGPYDLHCVSSVDPKFHVRVEVKATEVLKGRAFQTCKHDRHFGDGGILEEGFVLYDESDADIIAFAALDAFRVNFQPICELTKRGMTIDPGQFTTAIMRYTLSRSLDIVRQRKGGL